MREMKDSGVEWIGKIPKDWEIVPLTKQLDSIVDYRGKTPEKTEEGTFLVTAKNIKDGKICYELSKEYVREADYEEIMHRGIPQIGDILFTTEVAERRLWLLHHPDFMQYDMCRNLRDR